MNVKKGPDPTKAQDPNPQTLNQKLKDCYDIVPG